MTTTAPLGPFAALGSPFDITGDGIEAAMLWPILEPLHAPGASPVTTFSADRSSGGIDRLLWEITRWGIDRSTQTVVHAAAAVADSGAMVLPGASGSGKSTLVGMLVRRGLAYLTDEAVQIDADGLVAPFPKWLSLDAASCRVLGVAPSSPASPAGETHVPPRTLGPVAHAPAPVAMVVAPTFSAGAATELTTLTVAEGVMLLLANSFNADRLGADAISAAVDALRQARCYTLRYGDVVAACETIERLLSGE